MLSRSPYIDVVGTARDGKEALEMTDQLRPDVVTCDLVMPEMDGVGFVRQQMARWPVPILILTSSPQDGDRALEAMEAGAVDFIQKPTALATDDILTIREQLVEKVKAAARAPVARLHDLLTTPALEEPTTRRALKVEVVVIGISRPCENSSLNSPLISRCPSSWCFICPWDIPTNTRQNWARFQKCRFRKQGMASIFVLAGLSSPRQGGTWRYVEMLRET
jgi:CheY-like chemotaxis protein